MGSSFAIGLAGLSTNGRGLEVVGNNLANLNTIGFKASNITFSEVLGQLGSQVAGIHELFSQGGVETSANPLDVAIQGRGFFVLSNADGGRLYTRAGNFHLDKDGYLITEAGLNVQGFQRNPSTGQIDPSMGQGNIQVPAGLMPPVSTTEFQLGMNLDAGAADGARFSATVQIYDTQGKSHMATMALEKDIDTGTPPITRWRFDITIPESEVAGASPTSTNKFSLITGAVAVDPPAAASMQFDENGNLISVYTGADSATPPALANFDVPPSATTLPPLANGAFLSPMVWQLVGGASIPGVTGFASPSEMSVVTQNGAAPGSLSNLYVMLDGTLAAAFSNGKTMPVGQLVLAQFANNQGLVSEGEGLYRETPESGVSRFGTPGNSGLGRLIGSAIEQSNVDLAKELTRIITYQRGYQASARIITSSDEILQETLNLTR